ncbi:MAG: 4Fe-4S binding protein [bacterium]
MNRLLQEKAQELLDQNEVSLVIGYGEYFRRTNDESLQRIVTPLFISKPDEAKSLVWNDHCVHNLSAYLLRKEVKVHRRVALVAKGCDVKSICVLVQENQIKRNNVLIIGLTCQGVVGNSPYRNAEKCYSCQLHTPHICDILISSPQERSREPEQEPLEGSGSLQEKIDRLDRMSTPERWHFWKDQFGRCVRCYACRNICPLCYCERCIGDSSSPQWIEKGSLSGNLAFHIIRALHLSDRCTDCGECERVCPMGLPLNLLYHKMARIAKDLFQTK